MHRAHRMILGSPKTLSVGTIREILGRTSNTCSNSKQRHMMKVMEKHLSGMDDTTSLSLHDVRRFTQQNPELLRALMAADPDIVKRTVLAGQAKKLLSSAFFVPKSSSTDSFSVVSSRLYRSVVLLILSCVLSCTGILLLCMVSLFCQS